MGSELHIVTKVLPGNRVEVTNPELKEGDEVEVVIKSASPDASAEMTLMQFLDSLPEGPRSAATWEEVERQFREERDSWDR